MADENTAALAPDSGETIPRISLKEQGFAAIKTVGGKIIEEAQQQFRYPNMLKVVAEMKYSPPVSIGLGAINMLMNRAEVYVQPVVDETPSDRARREYLDSVLHDMDSSWQSTMQSISTYKEYGHQVSEIVLRRRFKRNGSRYDDGLVGLKGLKNRPQNSIAKWNFSEDGRELLSISQSINNLEHKARFTNLTDADGFIVIPREKFLLFRCDPVDDNPEGVSILRSAYLAYKQLSLLQDHMMTGVAKNVAGIPFAQIPPEYMRPDASADVKAVYDATKTILDNIAQGKAHSIIFPKVVDPDTKADLFSIEVLDQKATTNFNVENLIKMLQANILSVLSCNAVTMSSETGGSLSLQDSNTNLLAMQVSYRLSEIANTLNQELVPLLWKMNGWDTTRMPKIAFKDVSSVSIEEFTKGVQRLASTSTMEVNRANLNKIYEVMGFEKRPDDEPINQDQLPATLTGQITRSGDGMSVGTSGKGTGKNGVDNGQNSSDNNSNNKA